MYINVRTFFDKIPYLPTVWTYVRTFIVFSPPSLRDDNKCADELDSAKLQLSSFCQQDFSFWIQKFDFKPIKEENFFFGGVGGTRYLSKVEAGTELDKIRLLRISPWAGA